jgi:hypothetical protein
MHWHRKMASLFRGNWIDCPRSDPRRKHLLILKALASGDFAQIGRMSFNRKAIDQNIFGFAAVI